jgi:hypothetical protein
MKPREPRGYRGTLQFRLDVLQSYIQEVERTIDQLRIDMEKADLLHNPGDFGDFAVRTHAAVEKCCTALPRKDLIERDLLESRAELNQSYSKLPMWEDVKRDALALGVPLGDETAGFDGLLTNASVSVIRRLRDLASRADSGDGSTDHIEELARIMKGFWMVFDEALEPARHLRNQWLKELDDGGDTTRRKTTRQKRGRPKDPEVTERDHQIWTRWQTNQYKNYQDLAKEFKCSKDTVRKAIKAEQRKSRGKPSA